MFSCNDHPLVWLNDGRPHRQIDDQSIVATQVTVFTSLVWMNTPTLTLGAPFPLIWLFSLTPAFLSDKTSEQTAVSFQAFLKCLNEQRDVGMNRTKRTAVNVHIPVIARGLFWLMRVQYSPFNHISSIVILF